jgi:hypothetical protein
MKIWHNIDRIRLFNIENVIYLNIQFILSWIFPVEIFIENLDNFDIAMPMAIKN